MAPLQPRRLLGALLLVAASACGGGASDDAATAAPTRSGDVWEVAGGDRARAKSELLAFVSGTHALVVDGNDTYAGMRLTRGGKAPDGGQPLAPAGGIEATLAPAGDSMQLRFASGETLSLRKHVAKGGDR
ncbi:MAG TPA: hypothetical protein VGP25_18080 [Gemmatimonadaceae bacterium]|jgi:hypothetical protein|nr:hypothetical protein [Gemmatimonadaceae bacterium]